MIQNQDELTVVRRQLALAEDGLASLHRDILSRNPKNFAALSENYLEQIKSLRLAIESYLGLAPTECPTTNWLERVSGSMKDCPEFDQVLEYGRAFRNEDRLHDRDDK